jgi:glycosyltransferase involved in cell wall biosynthesis
MKLFIPIGSFYPNQKNGPSLSLYWLCKGLGSEPIDVTIYTTDEGICNMPLNKKLIFDYGEVLYVKTKFHKLPITLILKSLLRYHKSDIVIITSLFYPLSAVLLFYSFLFNKKLIISPRGEIYTNALNSKNKFIKIAYLKILNMIIQLKSTNYFFHATAIDELETIKQFFTHKARVEIIPNYIYLPAKVDKTFEKKYVLFLGRIHYDKALDKLIDAFALIRKRYTSSEIKLVLTGDQNTKYGINLFEYIKEQNLLEYVEFVGFVEGEKKNKLIANAMCTILISNSENFGNSVLESLCFGTPVITSKGTPWSQVEERKCGFWIDNNPDLINKRILDFVKMEDKIYKNMCENARDYAEEKFSIQKNKLVWMNLFKNI